ncbi:MAG: hypothetical protein QXU73_00725 [Thermoplasmata archaeon]
MTDIALRARGIGEFGDAWEAAFEAALDAIPPLADLRLDRRVRIDVKHDISSRPQETQALLDSGLLRRRRIVLDEETGERMVLKASAARQPIAIEILGAYQPDERRIVVYDWPCLMVTESIAQAMGSLTVPVFSGARLAMAHLVSHAVCHLGRDSRGRVWKNYGDASAEDKELLAQGLAFHFHRRSFHSSVEVEMFERLSRYMSAEYNQWRRFTEDLGPLREKLLAARASARDFKG